MASIQNSPFDRTHDDGLIKSVARRPRQLYASNVELGATDAAMAQYRFRMAGVAPRCGADPAPQSTAPFSKCPPDPYILPRARGAIDPETTAVGKKPDPR